MEENKSEFRVDITGLSKSFGIVSVLKNVNFRVKPGEIHALMGENGAGKSTLVKILCGVHSKNNGKILLDGVEIAPKNTDQGMKLGISVVYQELSLVNDLTVAENVFLHKLADSKFWINTKQLKNETDNLINSLGFKVDANAKVRNLSISQKQVVEIAKALSNETKVLVLDEPTTVFDPTDTQRLFDALENLKKKGISIVYISHHIEEIFKISDTVTVLRDGVDTGCVPTKDTNEDDVIKMMIGRELKDLYPARNVKIGTENILEVDGLTATESKVHDVKFSVKPGEVVGIAGLGGSGRTETARLIFGADVKKSGVVKFHGKKVKIFSPVDAVKNRAGFISEDRKEEGVFLSKSIKNNISITDFDSISNALGMIDGDKEVKNVEELIQKLNIKTSSMYADVKDLSGGNQQKVVLAKWLSTDCDIVLIDEPTRGVDVGAKVEIYNLINEVAARGVGLVIISSDMLEIMGISDRILVMHEGTIFGELTKDKYSEENILRLAIGQEVV